MSKAFGVSATRFPPCQRHWFTGSSRNDRNAFMIQQSLPVLRAGTAEGNAKVFYGSNSEFPSICANALVLNVLMVPRPMVHAREYSEPVSYAARSDRTFRFAGKTIRKLSSL